MLLIDIFHLSLMGLLSSAGLQRFRHIGHTIFVTIIFFYHSFKPIYSEMHLKKDLKLHILTVIAMALFFLSHVKMNVLIISHPHPFIGF